MGLQNLNRAALLTRVPLSPRRRQHHGSSAWPDPWERLAWNILRGRLEAGVLLECFTEMRDSDVNLSRSLRLDSPGTVMLRHVSGKTQTSLSGGPWVVFNKTRSASLLY